MPAFKLWYNFDSGAGDDDDDGADGEEDDDVGGGECDIVLLSCSLSPASASSLSPLLSPPSSLL